MDDLASDHRHQDAEVFNLVFRNRQVVPIQDDEVGPFVDLQRSQDVFLGQVVGPFFRSFVLLWELAPSLCSL